MAENMMKICGKTPDGVAKAICVDENGHVLTKRIWRTNKTLLVIDDDVANGGGIRDTASHNTIASKVDAREYAFVSLRINNDLDSDITFFLYDDDEKNTAYLVDVNGQYPQITIPKKSKVIVTPEDFPILNYLEFVKFRIQATTAPTSGWLQIWVVAKG